MSPLHKWSIVFLKFAPVVAALLMWLHVCGLLIGLDWFIAENLIALPIIPCITCCIWSKAFGFCTIHRCLICYTSLVTYCINWQSDLWGFGIMLPIVRWIVCILGLILFIWFFIKLKKHKYMIFKDT